MDSLFRGLLDHPADDPGVGLHHLLEEGLAVALHGQGRIGGSLQIIGTPNNLAVRDTLNEECIPQLLALTGRDLRD